MKTAFRNILIMLIIAGTLAVIYWLIINYYDDKNLQEAVTPFIKKTFLQQIELGAKDEALIVVGAGKNVKFIESLNNEVGFFKKVISLDHPRFIMQYRRKKLDEYIDHYLEMLVK